MPYEQKTPHFFHIVDMNSSDFFIHFMVKSVILQLES
jgi:hypothetical protein